MFGRVEPGQHGGRKMYRACEGTLEAAWRWNHGGRVTSTLPLLLAGTRYCWMSTGLYIPGRQIIEVSLPEAAASADLKVRHAPSHHLTWNPNTEARCSCFHSGHLT